VASPKQFAVTPPPVSSIIANVFPSHEKMPEWMNSNVSPPPGLLISVYLPGTFVVGFHGSETSHSWPSPAQDDASAMSFSPRIWMSWHAWKLSKPFCDVVSSASGCSFRRNSKSPPGAETSMIEIFLCGLRHAR
jgi:hypothetical protein